MANKEHLAKLQKGVGFWNRWRKRNSDVKPDLSSANFERANLSGVNLYNADLSDTNFQLADLRFSLLSDSDLENADFSCANLSRANLESAYLYCANLSEAKLTRTNLSCADLSSANFYCANLYKADLGFAHLESSNFYCANLERANLSYANLKHADFKYAILKRANLEYASLEYASLEHTNLIMSQTLATNFGNTVLTSSCIEDWTINGQTNLKNVKCDYIYVKQIYCEEEKKLIFADRIPHDPDKIFAPGEFSKRYQKILETVSLYFEDGVDWQAFLVSFNKLQVECESDELSINSFENKGNGAFVIKVNVPEGADKAEIEKYLKKQYQLEATVEAQQRELTNLYEITKLLASKPIINQNGNFGTGNLNGNVSDSQVSGINNKQT